MKIHRVPKRRQQTHGGNSVNSRRIFFTVRFSSEFAAKGLLKIPLHLIYAATLPCETLMSENELQSRSNVVINDKLHGTVITYLRRGGVVNNQIMKDLLLSLPVFF